MAEEQTLIDTDNNEIPYWAMYPQNVHAATSQGGSSFNDQTKKMAVFFLAFIFVVVITIVGAYQGSKLGLGIVIGILTFIVSLIIAIIFYSRVTRDKLNEEFESDTQNKILKLFRVRLNDTDQKVMVKGAELMSYTNGQVFVTLQFEIGNSNFASESVTKQFLETLFYNAHKLNLQVKNYNTQAVWRKSDVHYNHLKRLTKIQDSRLKATLASIDEHQSKTFDKSKIISLQIMFIARKNNVYGIESMVDWIDHWIEETQSMSSIRRIDWLDKDKTVEAMCGFLGVELLDITSSLNKKNIKFDIRKLVRMFNQSKFNADTSIGVESGAKLFRKSKRK